MNTAAPQAPPIRDAVSVVLIHGDRVLVVRRQPHLLAFPGYYAFPGGKVDRGDHDVPMQIPALAGLPPHLACALARELKEEVGLDLAVADAAGDILGVRPLGLAITPPFVPVRFATRYFAIELAHEPALVADPGEIADMEWARPADLVARYERGEMLAVPPTTLTLQGLAEDIRATHLSDAYYVQDENQEIPAVEVVKGVYQIAVRSNTLPPADRTNCFLLGDAGTRRVLIDPSPNSREELERLCSMIGRLGFDEIFLTHHHPDHCEFADEIARRFKRPIGMSADTRARLHALSGGRFFEGLEVRRYREGDELLRWLGQPVRVIEVPGHDEGHLALMPESRAWCIVSDLFQGVGTVVVGGPEGSMRKYFESLRKIIALNPRVLYPSHGVGVGTVWRLQETLRHREMREQQVKSMTLSGRSEDQMLAAIYPDVDPRLLPFARVNIRSHLQKLKEEGAIA